MEWVTVQKKIVETKKYRTKKQIYNEIEYVNSQFKNLRTHIVPDPKAERVDLFYFVMFPADGSLADKPIVGKMFFPDPYPEYPPVLHLFTLTHRYNVDVFYQGENSFFNHSSMCFDILSRNKDRWSIWDKSFNLAGVFASLLQVIVSVKVKQMYGDEKVELVSMEKMIEQHKQVNQIWAKYKHYFPNCPKFERVLAKKVPVGQKIEFDHNVIQLPYVKSRKVFSSSPFNLNKSDFSVLIDLTDLKKLPYDNYKYNYVISFVISNSKTDLIGSDPNTVLIRNGITGTAAKKLKSGETNWFYHGKPLVYFDKIMITVSRRQVTMVVADNMDKLNLKIHGDTVLTYLTDAEMRDSIKDELFYFNILVQAKNTIPASQDLPKLRIHIETNNKFGFVHPSEKYEDDNKKVENVIEKVNHISLEPLPLRLDLNVFEQNRVILNKQVYKYLSDLIKRHDVGLNETNLSENVIELNKFDVFCLKNLMSDWLISLPKDEQDPKQWKLGVFNSTIKDDSLNSVGFWARLVQANKPKPLFIEYTSSCQELDNVKFVGIDLGTSSKVIFKKLLVSVNLLHLLNNYIHVLEIAKVALANCDSVDTFGEYEPNELVQIKVIGLIYNQHQLVFIVDTNCFTISKQRVVNFYPENRSLFIEYAFKSFTKSQKNLSDKLKCFDKDIGEYICEPDETLVILEKPLVCLGKVKFYSFTKAKKFENFNRSI
ncbi:unnamed protein product [Brachionus calyciflorus]|uniref:Uncharacterized protein n=1 Tax=Brachionus calyciflorus TaxID=104777 RepID=A0A813UY02_9BILA|nr:unnamed protein product [Brachionus calyciflorus]